jgi:hypothetical protein
MGQAHIGSRGAIRLWSWAVALVLTAAIPASAVRAASSRGQGTSGAPSRSAFVRQANREDAMGQYRGTFLHRHSSSSHSARHTSRAR